MQMEALGLHEIIKPDHARGPSGPGRSFLLPREEAAWERTFLGVVSESRMERGRLVGHSGQPQSSTLLVAQAYAVSTGGTIAQSQGNRFWGAD